MKNYPLPSKISWWRLPEWLEKLTTRVEVLEDAPAPPITPLPYKVYTALLTQSGGENLITLNGGLLTIGVTYWINEGDGADFTNVGAPNNNPNTYFVATGTTPNSWGPDEGNPGSEILISNTGAPVVTVLENTIGNIWFTYNAAGTYNVNSNGLFTDNKTVIPNGSFLQSSDAPIMNMPFFNLGIQNADGIYLSVSTHPYGFDMDGLPSNDLLYNTPIEIRVYN